ncbi:hypothetical protein [Methylobacterium sp. NEAU K]|uniref:hypothetical protein n=1 Tax=Methylobacterium sp. NEAU K TaxID=3064946 RepID=UPI002732C390|nr:hypothetical protein [Methylobacterium sp. NEAU K]MDP4006905.1 hypothetical protein [Methylobacterium sp. NEAU K]
MSEDEELLPAKPPLPRPPHEMAVGYVKEAEAYHRAALLVHSSREMVSDVALMAPALFLLCHATELALKAYLLSHGADPGAKVGGLKNPAIGHNLVALYGLAVAQGFKATDDRLADMVEWLGPAHQAHSFRYRELGYRNLPLPVLFAEVLSSTIASIKRTVSMQAMAISREREDEVLRQLGVARAQMPEDWQ